MYPLPVSFPRASSNAAFISLAVTSCPAPAAFSNRSRISFSCASVNARRCDVYLFRISSSNPCSLYRLQIRLTLTRLIPVAFAAYSVVFPSYRIMSTRKRRLTFLSRVSLSAFFIALYSASVIWNRFISHHRFHYIILLLICKVLD